MRDIPDDPIVRCMMRTGYPPWMLRHDTADYEDDDYFADEEDDLDDMEGEYE